MNDEVKHLKEELAQEHQKALYYKQKYEDQKVENQNLHEALADLRRKVEKWHNSAEMEEEMIVNKLITKLDELKKDPSQSISTPSHLHVSPSHSFISQSPLLQAVRSEEVDDTSTHHYQKKIRKLQIEMEEKEKNIELLQLQLEAMKLTHSNSLHGKQLPHTSLSTIQEASSIQE